MAGYRFLLLLSVIVACGLPCDAGQGHDPDEEEFKQALKGLESDDDEVRAEAARTIGLLGSTGASAAGKLSGLLRDPSKKVRVASLFSLGELGRASQPALRDITRIAGEGDREEAFAAMDALGSLAPLFEQCLGALAKHVSHPNRAYRYHALMTLRLLGAKAAPVVPRLLEALDEALDSEDRILVQIVSVLESIGPGARHAADRLAGVIESAPQSRTYRILDLRAHAAWAISAIGQPSDSCIKALRGMSQTGSPQEVAAATFGLWRLRGNKAGVVAALVRCLKNNKFPIRCMEALRAMGPLAGDAIPQLILETREGPGYQRATAIGALGSVGPDDQSAKKTVLDALRDQDASVRRRAAEALGQIGARDPQVVTSLLAALGDEDDGVQCAVIAAIGRQGAMAEVAIPALMEIVTGFSFYGEDAIRALAEIRTASAVKALIALLKEEGHVTGSVAAALGSIGPRAKAAVPALRQIANLDWKPMEDRQAAIEAIRKIMSPRSD